MAFQARTLLTGYTPVATGTQIVQSSQVVCPPSSLLPPFPQQTVEDLEKNFTPLRHMINTSGGTAGEGWTIDTLHCLVVELVRLQLKQTCPSSLDLSCVWVKPGLARYRAGGSHSVTEGSESTSQGHQAHQQVSTLIRPISHCSPEELLEHRHSPQSVVWSVGVVFYQMLYGCLPFRASSGPQLAEELKSFSPEFPKVGLFRQYSPFSVNLLMNMLRVNPRERHSLQQVLQDIEAIHHAKKVSSPGAILGGS